jgi:hypothetical protein
MRVLVPFCQGAPEQSFYQEFHYGVCEALRELGHEPVVFPFAKPDRPAALEAKALVRLVDLVPLGAVLDLACWGFGLSRVASSPAGDHAPRPLLDGLAVPYVALLLDQPANQALNGIVASRLYAAYPDLGHPEQVRLVFPGLKPRGELFAPPAVRPENDCSAPAWADRDIEVLYVGNLLPEALDRFWSNPNSSLWRRYHDRAFCDALADAVLEHPERSLHLAVRATLAAFGPPAATLHLNPQFRAVEYFLRYRFRHDAVLALARSGVPLQVVGRGWDKIALPPNVTIGAETTYDGFFSLAGRAKVCLDASTYLDGANDRVFTYALNRAVCLTNSSGYLRGVFGEEGGALFYSMHALSELGERVRALLSSPQSLAEKGQLAKQVVLSAHTWRHRVEAIIARSAGTAGSLPRGE